MFNKRSKRYNIKILIFIFSIYIMNPIGNTGFMSAPPPSYTDYFNSLKSTPKNEDVNNDTTLPLDPRKLKQLKAFNDYKKMTEEKNKILPMKHYKDQPHTSVHSEPEYKTQTKPSKKHNVDIHHQKHISPKPRELTREEMEINERKMRHQNAMRLEQGLAPLSIQEQFPVKTKISMKLPSKPAPVKPKTDSKGFPTGKLPSIASASKNPTPNIKAGDRGSIQNPIYSTDKQTSKPKPKAKPTYKTDSMGFPILGSEYDIGNVSSSTTF